MKSSSVRHSFDSGELFSACGCPLFGDAGDKGLVAVEHRKNKGQKDEIDLFFRRNGKTLREHVLFEPWLISNIEAISACPVEFVARKLNGSGMINLMASFGSWEDCLKARNWLSAETKFSQSAPRSPYMFISDPVQQYLMRSGRNLFLGMQFEELRRLQVDIECFTSSGYEFCNPERDGDRIIAIALSDQTGWVEVISGAEMDEKEMIKRFVKIVHERDPDVIEGYNIFNFDLCYLSERAKRHGVKLTLGRDGSVPRRRASRFSVGDRTIAYERFDIFGRHVVDILFLVHAYDVSHRSLSGFGLKDVAAHFGVVSPDRVYIKGSEISEEFKRNPGRLMKYAGGDVIETGEISRLISRSNFIQTQMVPYSYQNTCVRGNIGKIDALMIREYIRKGYSIPCSDRGRQFEGGYTDIFIRGVVENVHHCDARSLYPSLMLLYGLGPRKDEAGVFLSLLRMLKDVRQKAKERMTDSSRQDDILHFEALQSAFKVLINSFYGYLGSSQARFSDFDIAEDVTARGRALLRSMILWLKNRGAMPVEIDTDGIYFVPPQWGRKIKGRNAQVCVGGKGRGAICSAAKMLEKFRNDFADSLPAGIDVEFDGEYVSMYSYKMKNYALLAKDGEVIIKGAALKSRGLEPFQRAFLRDVIRLKLEKKEKKVSSFKGRYEKSIRDGEWPIEQFAKTETLQESPEKYAMGIKRGEKSRRAVYELALKSGRKYGVGDQLSYYVTGTKKNLSVYENAKMVSEWDADKRDENIVYYLDKLESLYNKFCEDSQQAELELE